MRIRDERGESVVQSRVWVVCYLNPALSERTATGSLASAWQLKSDAKGKRFNNAEGAEAGAQRSRRVGSFWRVATPIWMGLGV
jgi:hypothetical protein